MSTNKASLLAAMLLGLGISSSAYAAPDCEKNPNHKSCQGDGGDDGSGDVVKETDYSNYCGGIATGVLNDLSNSLGLLEEGAIAGHFGNDTNCDGEPDEVVQEG